MDDEGIIALYWARSEAAIAETDNRYGAYCHRISFDILHSREDAEECVSDTWLRAWNAIPPEQPRSLSAFLGRITRNLSLDQWKRNHTKKRSGCQISLALEELEQCIPASRVTEAVERMALASAIERFLDTLPEQSCHIFIRRYWHLYAVKEIARQYGLRENTVKSILFRTRNSLRTFLEKEGIAI